MTKYRADIDGLRALAVLPVVLFHAKIPGFSGGFVGVDIFFVISGFLITTIIHTEIQENRFSLVHFYERRARRILPALFAVVAASCIAAALLLFPDQYRSFARSVVATAIFASSILFYRESGYFDLASEEKPLLHTWSLSVEEIYYVFFPLLMLAIAYVAPRLRIAVLTLLGIGSFAIAVIALQADPKSKSAFFLPHARAWEFLIGSLLAILPSRFFDRPWLMQIAATVGLILVLAPVSLYSAETTFPGFAAIPPCLGTALIIAAGRANRTAIGQLLSNSALVYIGLISYSLYLWHWPMLVFARAYAGGELSIWQSLCVIALSLVVAALSLRFIERPFRGKSSLISKRQVLQFSAAGIVAFIGMGLHGDLTEGWISRYPADKVAIFTAHDDRDQRRKRCLSIATDAPGCTYGEQNAAPKIGLWGDSHAAVYAQMLGGLAAERGNSVLVHTMPSCPPVAGWALPRHSWRDACLKFQARAFERFKSSPSIEWIILAGRFDGYPFAEASSPFRARLEATIRDLQAAGKRIAVVYPVPYPGKDVPLVLKQLTVEGETPNDMRQPIGDFRRGFAREIKFLDDLVKSHGLMPIKPHAKMCDGTACYFYRDGVIYYHDSHHLSLTGARQLKPLFAPLFGKP